MYVVIYYDHRIGSLDSACWILLTWIPTALQVLEFALPANWKARGSPWFGFLETIEVCMGTNLPHIGMGALETSNNEPPFWNVLNDQCWCLAGSIRFMETHGPSSFSALSMIQLDGSEIPNGELRYIFIKWKNSIFVLFIFYIFLYSPIMSTGEITRSSSLCVSFILLFICFRFISMSFWSRKQLPQFNPTEAPHGKDEIEKQHSDWKLVSWCLLIFTMDQRLTLHSQSARTKVYMVTGLKPKSVFCKMVCSTQTGADIFTSAIIDCKNGASPLSI